MDNSLVFVYGTLKSGHPNHYFLEKSEKICECSLALPYIMINLGKFPGLVKTPVKDEFNIKGEIYRVDKHTLKMLDMLEGVPLFYKRVKVPTEYGDAYTYVLEGERWNSFDVIEKGEW